MLPGFDPSHSPALATRTTPVATERPPTPRTAITPTFATQYPRHGAQAAARSPTLTSVTTRRPAASPSESAASA